VTNQRLRGALLNAGMTAAALADAVQVDPKSVSRWLAEDRIPHQATRQKVAVALQQQETFLWPTLLTDSDGCTAGLVDIERVWPTRSSIPSETWHALFSKATETLDILVYAGAFLIETLDLADVLAWKADRRTRIRILVADPHSSAVGLRAAELSLDWLPQRCQSSLDYLRRVDGISLRPHGASHYASLFRFDDLLLANTHAYGIWACHSPVLQVHRSSSGKLFDFYTTSFESTWRSCEPEPRATRTRCLESSPDR
jgi:transcriptional regulator with XRE-family HTH domain